MEHKDDLATLWSLPSGMSCIIRPSGFEWNVRLERDGVTVRESTMPNGQSAVALGNEWEAEFTRSAASWVTSRSIQ